MAAAAGTWYCSARNAINALRISGKSFPLQVRFRRDHVFVVFEERLGDLAFRPEWDPGHLRSKILRSMLDMELEREGRGRHPDIELLGDGPRCEVPARSDRLGRQRSHYVPNNGSVRTNSDLVRKGDMVRRVLRAGQNYGESRQGNDA